MRFGLPVELEPMPIKPPGPAGALLEGVGRSNYMKIQPGLGQGRIGLPEAFPSPKIRQAGIHAHPRPSGDQQPITIGKGLPNSLAFVIGEFHSLPRCVRQCSTTSSTAMWCLA